MLRLALLALLLATAQSSGTVFTSSFATGLEGWVVTPASGGVGWDADNTPATSPPSAPNCLNYNDGVDYDNGSANSGTATSPPINLAGATSATLTFQCYFDTEDPFSSAFFDTRRLQISTNGFASMAIDEPLGIDASSVVGPCTDALMWHSHTVSLPGPLLASGVEIRFAFDTVDDVLNDFQGWFIDNVDVSAVGVPPPPPPPGGGGPVVGGASRDNANGDQGINDLFCSAGAGGSMIAMLFVLAALIRYK